MQSSIVYEEGLGVKKKRQTWDEYFMGMAKYVASRSKDRSTKVGAIAVGPDKEVRMTSYNGFPRGVNDEVESRHERPAKYLYTAHGEENIVSLAALVGVSLKGCTVYVICLPEPLPPCATCARMMIQSGVRRVVYKKAKQPTNPEVLARWKESSDAALEMLSEAGIKVCIMSEEK
jgi:dCMP deaminase